MSKCKYDKATSPTVISFSVHFQIVFQDAYGQLMKSKIMQSQCGLHRNVTTILYVALFVTVSVPKNRKDL